jgi:fructokinase
VKEAIPLKIMNRRRTIVGLGEMLWDMLPDGERLGGAPANFAVMASRLGDRGAVASRLGKDDLGQRALDVLAQMPVNLSFLQSDEEYPTGTVSITLAHGEPEYTFHEPVAWDRLTFTDEWRDLAQQADAVCFGTLAQREDISRETIQKFVSATRAECVRVFDVNLRESFFSADVILRSLAKATVVKLNETEVPRILSLTGLGTATSEEGGLREAAGRMLERFPLQLVCVTLGAHGSLLVSRSGYHRHPGVPVVLKDAIGAGDAFTAALTHYYLEGAPLPVLNEAGNRWGSWVASQAGAMPPLPTETLTAITREISSL